MGINLVDRAFMLRTRTRSRATPSSRFAMVVLQVAGNQQELAREAVLELQMYCESLESRINEVLIAILAVSPDE